MRVASQEGCTGADINALGWDEDVPPMVICLGVWLFVVKCVHL